MSFLTSNSASSLEISPEATNLLPGGFHLTKDSRSSQNTGYEPNQIASGHTYDFMSDSKLISTSEIIAQSIQVTQQSTGQFKRAPANTRNHLIEASSSSSDNYQEPVKEFDPKKTR